MLCQELASILLTEKINSPNINPMAPPRINHREGKISPAGREIEGRYANFFKVGHNAFEFVIDFGQYFPETDQAELYTRIVTNPSYAKSLLHTLEESIYRYEETFGSIKT